MATMTGVLFAAALLLSPTQGLIAKSRRAARNRLRFASELLVVHLLTHERTPEHASESSVAHLGDELRWSSDTTSRAIAGATRQGFVVRSNGHLELTDAGRRSGHRTLAR